MERLLKRTPLLIYIEKLSVEYVVYYWMNRLPRAPFMKPVFSVN